MQLNRNYSARLHVGKNNGPSYIIALGEYQGGRLWCYDKDGDTPRRLPKGQSPFKGFPTSILDREKVVKEFDGDQVVDTFYHKGEQVRSARANQTQICYRTVPSRASGTPCG